MRRLNVSQNSGVEHLYYCLTSLTYIFVPMLLNGETLQPQETKLSLLQKAREFWSFNSLVLIRLFKMITS